MRHMLWLLLLLVVTIAVAQEGPSITSARAELRAALDQKDAQAVWKNARLILELAAKQDQAKLSALDLYAVGIAHYYLVGEAMELALASGSLPEDEAKIARGLRNDIMAATRDPGDRLKVVGHGQQINLADFIPEGKTTIVDFYSEYCPPCRALAPRLEQLATDDESIQIIKVDINRPGVEGIDWQSPVAQQFKLRSIPFLMVFGEDKQLRAQGDEAMDEVMGLLGEE